MGQSLYIDLELDSRFFLELSRTAWRAGARPFAYWNGSSHTICCGEKKDTKDTFERF